MILKKVSVVLAGIAALMFSVTGCGGSKKFVSSIPDEMQQRIDRKWQDAIWALGIATGPKENLAVSKATANARAELARQFRSQIDALEKAYEEAINDRSVEEYTQVKEIFASLEVSGSKQDMVLTSQQKDGWHAKVLLVVSAEQFKAALDDKLNAYTSFKAQEAYKELEARVEREKERQKNMGE